MPAQTGCVSAGRNAARHQVAFNTANLVARCTNYRFELNHWGEQHQKTVAMTDEAAWAAICREIAAAGFRAVEVGEAHAAPERLNEANARPWIESHLRSCAVTRGSFAPGSNRDAHCRLQKRT